jgi:purine-binding chemotaxis protein CheW
MMPNHPYCTFFLDGMFFGVEVCKVQEVIRNQEMTRVPLAHRTISGLMNLRGQIVTAIDLRRRLGLADRPMGQGRMNVVVQTPDGAASLIVDEIGDVREVTADSFESPPSTLTASARKLIRGAYKLPDRLLLVLDIEQVLSISAGELDSPPTEAFSENLA